MISEWITHLVLYILLRFALLHEEALLRKNGEKIDTLKAYWSFNVIYNAY